MANHKNDAGGAAETSTSDASDLFRLAMRSIENRDVLWDGALGDLTQACIKGIKLHYHSAGDPRFEAIAALAKVTQALGLALSLSQSARTQAREPAEAALRALKSVADRYFATIGEGVEPNRPDAAEFLRDQLASMFRRYLAHDDCGDPKATHKHASWMASELVSLLAEWGPWVGPIAAELPPDFRAREGDLVANLRGRLLRLDIADLETHAVNALEAGLVALGYPTARADSLGRQLRNRDGKTVG